MPPTIDRRRSQRVELDRPVTAKVSTATATLHDVSAEGARIEHPFPLALGRKVTLHFAYGGERVSVDCQVVRCRYEKHGTTLSYFSGLKFGENQDATVANLRRIIQDMLASSPAGLRPEATLNAPGA